MNGPAIENPTDLIMPAPQAFRKPGVVPNAVRILTLPMANRLLRTRLLRSRARSYGLTGLLATLVLLLSGTYLSLAQAHPFHVSVAEAEWNREKSQLEVAIRIDANHLEQALRKQLGTGLVLEQPETEARLEGYVRQNWQTRTADGAAVRLVWVGFEIEDQTAWIYFAVPLPDGWKGSTVTHRLLLEEVSEQSNLLILREAARGTCCTLRFHRELPTQRLVAQPASALPADPTPSAEQDGRQR